MDSNTFALGLIALLTAGACVLLWQIFATARARMAARHERVSLELAERIDEQLPQIDERLREVARELREMRQRLDRLDPVRSGED